MERIVSELEQLKAEYERIPVNENAREVDRKEFTLLLGGISACRKVPGIQKHMGYEKLYLIEDKNGIVQAREHLAGLFGVKDEKSLEEACNTLYSGGEEYEQFMTFWVGAPLFDMERLNPEGRKVFMRCRELAENFYPLVKEKGLYAWDINEKIGLCRSAVACGILSEDAFWELTDNWVRQAQVFYHSYVEYGMSCMCGALYEMGRSDSDVKSFFEINRNILAHLLGKEGAWNRNKWYVPQEREWVHLLNGNPGCIITKKALEEERVGYMYCEEPDEAFPDSGWRFFVGDESDEYVNNAENLTVCALNTVCNIAPDIIAYLHADIGSGFGRSESGWEAE